MNGGAALLVTATLAALLAGCASQAPVPPAGLGPDELEDGGFYAFRHGGGDLVFALAGDGSAEVVLFGADDVRVGRIGLGEGQASGRFVLDGVGRGEPVVQVLSLNGTLDLRSGGARVSVFERLPVHIERHTLLQRPLGPLGVVGLPGLDPDPADEAIDLHLLRAPSVLRVLAHGVFENLEVRLTGRAGEVLAAEEAGGPFQAGFGQFGFQEIPGEGSGENVRDGDLEAHIVASHFEGVLLLEAESFSRARAPADGGTVTDETPRFTYGVLPDQPVSFHVRPGTEWLYLFQEGDAASEAARDACRDAEAGAGEAAEDETCDGPAAHVALFGPDDERVATVRVPANATIAVAVPEAGQWVAVLLEGEATLGADRAPADFELHPLDVVAVTAPSQSASGRDGEYGQASGPLQPSGVAFRLHALDASSTGPVEPAFVLGPAQCGPSTLVAQQGGETIGAWGFDPTAPEDEGLQATLLLDGGELTLVHADFGPTCARQALQVDGYVR